MSPTDRPGIADLEPCEHRGRSFVRVAIPDRDPSATAAIVPRTLADRFRVVDLFALGELSFLLRARDECLRRDVVIKAIRPEALFVPPEVPDRPQALEAEVRRARHALQTERRLLVRLRNAGCDAVPVPIDYLYDDNPALQRPPFCDVDGQPLLGAALLAAEPFLVLPLLEGVTLEELLAREFPEGMDESDAIALILPIVRVLEVLHQPWTQQNGRTWHCVYQDLKPANILVGLSGRATLIDFGGCQVVVDGVPVLEGACTPGYAPPECEGPARVLLPCADVYTLGATLYHMLTGIDPREALDLARLPSRVSPALRDFLHRCLAPRPSDRPADARRVAEVLAGLGRTMNLTSSP
jgi:serine/threonine protein kinase